MKNKRKRTQPMIRGARTDVDFHGYVTPPQVRPRIMSPVPKKNRSIPP
jgi:hypothetical protein